MDYWDGCLFKGPLTLRAFRTFLILYLRPFLIYCIRFAIRITSLEREWGALYWGIWQWSKYYDGYTLPLTSTGWIHKCGLWILMAGLCSPTGLCKFRKNFKSIDLMHMQLASIEYWSKWDRSSDRYQSLTGKHIALEFHLQLGAPQGPLFITYLSIIMREN